MNTIPVQEFYIAYISTVVLTAIFFLEFEQNSYRASWRMHGCGIILPCVIMQRCNDVVVRILAISFAMVHVMSILMHGITDRPMCSVA
jgi:hypothetical protein